MNNMIKTVDLHTHSTFSDGTFSPAELVKKAVEKNVAVVPGNAFLMDDTQESHFIRLNFSTPSDDGIINGVKALGEVAKSYR